MENQISPKKKALTIFVCLLLLVVILAGCSSSSNESSGKNSAAGNDEIVTVKYANFTGGGDKEAYLLRMKDAFEKQNPTIKIDIESIGYGDYFTQIQTRVASNSAPDAYELNIENFISYTTRGVLLDLNPLLESSDFDRSAVNAQAFNTFSTNGSQFGMPVSFSNVVLIYNKDLFDRAGVAYPTNDWTWADMQEAAVKIRALDDNIFGLFQSVHIWEFFKAVQQNGGGLYNEDMTEFTINRPENVATLENMSKRVYESNVMPTDIQLSGMGESDLFKEGRLGMMLQGIWSFDDLVNNANFEWDIAVEPGNLKKATHFFSNGIVVNKDSRVAEAAFEWAKFMSASKEAAEIRIEANWELPAITDSSVLQAYLEKTPPNNRQAVFDSLEFLIIPPIYKDFNLMADIVNVHLSQASQGVKTAQQALDDAQAEVVSRLSLE